MSNSTILKQQLNDWKGLKAEEWFLKLALAGAVGLIALTTVLKNVAEQTHQMERMSDSLFRRLRIHCCSTVLGLSLLISIFLIFYFSLNDTGNFTSFAVLAGLTLAFWTNVEIWFQLYRGEAELSVLLLATATKYQCFETSFKNVSDAKNVWPHLAKKRTSSETNADGSPTSENCLSRASRPFSCFVLKIIGCFWLRTPFCPPCRKMDKESRRDEALLNDEIESSGRLSPYQLLPTCLVPKWRLAQRHQLLYQLRKQRLSYDNRPRRLTTKSDRCFASATVVHFMNLHLSGGSTGIGAKSEACGTDNDTKSEPCGTGNQTTGSKSSTLANKNNQKWYRHACRVHVPENPKTTKKVGDKGKASVVPIVREEENAERSENCPVHALISLEYAARADLPDMFGNMMKNISETSGLGSQSKAWFVVGSEIVANLHLCLGIANVEHPKDVHEAQGMYNMLLAFDSTFLIPEIQNAIAQRVVDQNQQSGIVDKIKGDNAIKESREHQASTTFDGETTGDLNKKKKKRSDSVVEIDEQITDWCSNHGVLESLTESVRKAIHWITIGLIIQWGGRRNRSIPITLWEMIKKTLETTNKEGFVKRNDDTYLAWYCESANWPSVSLQGDIIAWAIDLLDDEGDSRLKDIAKESGILKEVDGITTDCSNNAEDAHGEFLFLGMISNGLRYLLQILARVWEKLVMSVRQIPYHILQEEDSADTCTPKEDSAIKMEEAPSSVI